MGLLTVELANHDAEALFLAGLIRHPDTYYSVNDIGIEPNDLLGQENRRVLKAILAVVANKKVPELPLVIEELKGGDSSLTVEYLNRLMGMACSPAQAIDYAKTIKGLSISRQLTQAGASIFEVAREKRADADSALAEAESILRGVRDTMPVPDRSPAIVDILRRMRQQGSDPFIPIRFSSTLQQISGGLRPGHLWVIGGFSSTGKSAVSVNFIIDQVLNRTAVAVVSPEMTQEQYTTRLLSAMSGIPQTTLRDRLPGDMESTARLEASERLLNRTNLRIFDNVFRISQIMTKAKQVKETSGLDLLIVDYIQMIRGSAGDFGYQDTTEVILDLQSLAKDLSITIIAFSQISNEQAKWDGDSNYYGFKGSGSIKDAADLAVMLKRDRVGQSPHLTFDVVKNRHGEMRSILMKMDLPTGRIVEAEYQDEEPV
jgi:replicative DNA helicase